MNVSQGYLLILGLLVYLLVGCIVVLIVVDKTQDNFKKNKKTS